MDTRIYVQQPLNSGVSFSTNINLKSTFSTHIYEDFGPQNIPINDDGI